ncbi:hypothetical protein TWF718_008851 [Orbilia javanica]|uniref:RRM domain-containing protein n=1 Tax=Orbilia javanica TaxID=47235 RepID=A0AAN8MNN9_9PEZI
MQQPNEGLPPKPMGGRRFQDREPQNERLMIHIANIPPMMPEDVVKQAATQFGPVKDFFKVNRHHEKAYEYAPCFGFLTFEHEDSVARALDAGWMFVGETRLSLNARRPREHRNQGPPRTSGDFRTSGLPNGPGALPDRPPSVRGQAQAPVHSRKQSNSSQFENKGPFPGPHRGTRASSSTCTIYGLPENFQVQDLLERGNSFGRVINAHIFEYKDRDGRRFGTINFDSSSIAEEFHNKENGQTWNGCAVKITFEPFNVARRNNAPPFRATNPGPQNFHRHEQRPFDGPKRFQNGNRGPRYPQNNNTGRFNNQRGPFQHHGNGYQPHGQYQIQNQQNYPAEQHFYDPQMMGYPQQYQPQYPQAMNHHVIGQTHYGSGVISPPLPYGQQMPAHGVHGPYHHSPPLAHQPGMHPMHGGHAPYPGPNEYPHHFDHHRNMMVGGSPNSKHSSASHDTTGAFKISGEAPMMVPAHHSDIHGGSIIIAPGHYRQAGYQYGGHISENVHPLNIHHAQQHQAVEAAPAEPPMLPATVPETKDPEDPSNIFIKNIDDDLISKPEHLEEYCKKFGEVVSISLPAYSNGLIKGFGFVKFTTPEAALKAKEELNLQIVGRKRLFVSFAETSDHRHSRLAKFYDQTEQTDQGSTGQTEKSPPDPLLQRMNDKAKSPEKKAQADEGTKDKSSKPQADGDATTDTPIEKPSGEEHSTKQSEALVEGTTVLAKTQEPLICDPVVTEKATETLSLKEASSDFTTKPSHDQEDKVNQTAKKTSANEESVSVDPNELRILLEAEMNGAKGKSIGRRLTPEEAMKLDPAIISVERPENATISRDSPTTPTLSTLPNEAKEDRLKLVLKGLQANDSNGPDPPDHQPTTVRRKRLSDSERKELGEGILEALKANANESPEGKEGLQSQPIRSDTRNSTSSSGSRVSQEEFSEALKEKFGPKIPSTIRATEVMEAVDKYVESRSITREPSPTANNSESTAKEGDHNTKAEMSNIVAPAPSRKVSIRKIVPSDTTENKPALDGNQSAETEDKKVMESVPEESQDVIAKEVIVKDETSEDVRPGQLQATGADVTSLEASDVAQKAAPAEIAAPISTDAPHTPICLPEAEQNAPASTAQSIPALCTDDQSAYYSEAAGSRRSGPGTQQKNNYGSLPKHPRNFAGNQGPADPAFRQGYNNGGITSPPYSKYSRSTEHSQAFQGFHNQHNEQYNPHVGPNFGPHSPPGSHPPTIICDGPCPQPQCQQGFTPFVPIPDMSHMFQGHINTRMQQMGPMPGQGNFYDPAMHNNQYGYPGDNNGFPPQFFGGGPAGMYPHPPQWANTGNNGPSMGPHPQGGFMYPPHHYSPPHGHHQAGSPPRMSHMDQIHPGRGGFPEYGQHPPMQQQFGGPMFPDQMMQGGPPPPPFHGQGQYRPPHGGVPSF